MKDIKGLVFDIQSYSVHDGPGCRTSVFMMGCPLRCTWCANPEGRKFKKKLLYRSSRCINRTYGCTACIDSCQKNAIEAGEELPLKINRDLCETCNSFDCVETCFQEALVICGKEIALSELMKVLSRDRNYWGSEGGVTFTGGEPLFQKDFLLTALKRCREAYIHTAIETSCYGDNRMFLEVMKYIDFAFLDIKHMDGAKHKEYTGVDNKLILENIKSLSSGEYAGRIVIRLPVIEGFNDDRNNISEMIDFLSELKFGEVNILSFNPLGESKWTQCGMDYPYKGFKATPKKVMDKIQKMFLERDIICYIDHNTLW